jgi:phage FluMu protein gp41
MTAADTSMTQQDFRAQADQRYRDALKKCAEKDSFDNREALYRAAELAGNDHEKAASDLENVQRMKAKLAEFQGATSVAKLRKQAETAQRDVQKADEKLREAKKQYNADVAKAKEKHSEATQQLRRVETLADDLKWRFGSDVDYDVVDQLAGCTEKTAEQAQKALEDIGDVDELHQQFNKLIQ